MSESLELSNFMEKVKKHDNDTTEELRELEIQDWARLWRQILKDLRYYYFLYVRRHSAADIFLFQDRSETEESGLHQNTCGI